MPQRKKRPKRSQGELAIAKYLEDACIDFEEQKMYPETGKLRFDFYLPDLCILIEMDGRQHFAPFRNNTRGKKQFRIRREYDLRKNKFCLEHNIPLLRIAHTCQPRIPDILEEYLHKIQNSGIYYSNQKLYENIQL